ncbi:BolA/IbaG family iron-sulfur metabolism protein [Dasania sp. GY-MA-18]|uniref:DNA-binding transcriptional regulator BolA n=1 Tax=Dasania phycosphaerae TaxID=2950436 RepID=A0A9J6RNH0_9GAMM|nr:MULTISPECIES: BolA/IbaG family iron-sulfur metabolism protein [Dasania]MCR8923296.1 BolA/IbaG family iron-sulfur metabolism protein [Dasania sp. GY-MA-18]MCZ0865728.1 BolA/IbaG family iron-sulfur metabolism protein [Dasania phycosphaerae]MCZ0869453.1 BolA/IbaG family iron-sulfur metabolism protein [Dasania phycosphaerae]
MSVEASLRSKLQQHFNPSYLQVDNESHMHSVPANSETHFKLVVVADGFQGQRAIARHQQIYKLLAEELAGPIHALAIHTYTPEEWQQQAVAPDSPNCMGRR